MRFLVFIFKFTAFDREISVKFYLIAGGFIFFRRDSFLSCVVTAFSSACFGWFAPFEPLPLAKTRAENKINKGKAKIAIIPTVFFV